MEFDRSKEEDKHGSQNKWNTLTCRNEKGNWLEISKLTSQEQKMHLIMADVETERLETESGVSKVG